MFSVHPPFKPLKIAKNHFKKKFFFSSIFGWGTLLSLTHAFVSWHVQWDQSSPGNSASHYSDQSIIKLDFLAA